MKKVFSTVLALVFSLVLTACNGESAPSTGTASNNDAALDANSTTEQTENQTTTTAPSVGSSSDTEWREFLQDYEAWVDEYIALTQKYNVNPTDPSLLAEYTDMASEMTEWANKADDLKADLENASAEELSEYTTELNRIADKLAQAAQ